MNIRTFLGLFTSSLHTEIQLNIDALERQLIQHELAAFEADAKVAAIKGKLEYLKSHNSIAPTESKPVAQSKVTDIGSPDYTPGY